MVAETHFSHAVGDVCCERCHCAASPPISLAARRYKPPPPPPRLKLSAFQAYHARVWDRLELLTDSPIFLMGVGCVACYCPRCLDGTMVVQFRDAERPLIVISSDGREGCSLGCTEHEIAEVLFG